MVFRIGLSREVGRRKGVKDTGGGLQRQEENDNVITREQKPREIGGRERLWCGISVETLETHSPVRR